jgi:hypothetical protein
MRIFYFPDGGEGAEGGGNSTDTATTTTTDKPVDSILTAAELKEYGLENADQLKTILRQHKESNIPAAEKEKQEQERKADFISFAAKNGHMKVEEINAYESVKSKADRDLVFEKHLQQFKEDNPEITDPEELTTQARADFESEYKLTSDNEKQKNRGEARMKKEAEELRSPHTSKYEKTQSAYQERKALEGKLPEFNKAITALIEKCTPEKLTLSKIKEGDTELPIEVELSKKERDEIIKTFVTPKMYREFAENEKDLSKFEAKATQKINGFLREKYFDEVVSKSYEKGKGVGTGQGSNVGAEQPYAIVRNMSIPSTEGKQSADKEVMDNEVEIRRKIHNR